MRAGGADASGAGAEGPAWMFSANFQPFLLVALGSALGKVTIEHLKQGLSPTGLSAVGGSSEELHPILPPPSLLSPSALLLLSISPPFFDFSFLRVWVWVSFFYWGVGGPLGLSPLLRDLLVVFETNFPMGARAERGHALPWATEGCVSVS